MDTEVPSYYLYPAAMFASAEPFLVNTILGSCVSVCLYDPVRKSGGINHYMLPLWNGNGLASPKYGNIAIEKLLEKMIGLGSLRQHLQAKVFGGGDVLSSDINLYKIGTRNIQIAIDMLAEYRIPIVSKSTGGNQGRKIQFDTYTGNVRHKFVPKQIMDVTPD